MPVAGRSSPTPGCPYKHGGHGKVTMPEAGSRLVVLLGCLAHPEYVHVGRHGDSQGRKKVVSDSYASYLYRIRKPSGATTSCRTRDHHPNAALYAKAQQCVATHAFLFEIPGHLVCAAPQLGVSQRTIVAHYNGYLRSFF